MNPPTPALKRLRESPITREEDELGPDGRHLLTVAGYFVDEATIAEIEIAVREGIGSLSAYRIAHSTSQWDGEVCLRRIAGSENSEGLMG